LVRIVFDLVSFQAGVGKSFSDFYDQLAESFLPFGNANCCTFPLVTPISHNLWANVRKKSVLVKADCLFTLLTRAQGRCPQPASAGKDFPEGFSPAFRKRKRGDSMAQLLFLRPAGAPARTQEQRLPYAGEDSGPAPESASGPPRNDFPPYGENGGRVIAEFNDPPTTIY